MQADEKTVAVPLACPIVCGVRRFGEIGYGGYENAQETEFNFGSRAVRYCRYDSPGTRAGHYASGQPGGGWRAEDFVLCGGNGGAIRIVPKRKSCGLASDKTRNADCDAFWRYATASSRENAGRGAATNDLLSGCRDEWKIPSEWRRLYRVFKRYRGRGMVSAVQI